MASSLSPLSRGTFRTIPVDACAFGAEHGLVTGACWRNIAGIVPHCAETFAHLVRGWRAGRRMDQPVYFLRSGGDIITPTPRVQGAALTDLKSGAPWRHRRRSALKNRRWNWNDVISSCWTMPILRSGEIGVQARLTNAERVCTAAKRFILHEKIAVEFSASSPRRSRKVKVGDQMDASTELGRCRRRCAGPLTRQVESGEKWRDARCTLAASRWKARQLLLGRPFRKPILRVTRRTLKVLRPGGANGVCGERRH